MVIRINDKNQNYNNVTKLLVKPRFLKRTDESGSYIFLVRERTGPTVFHEIRIILETSFLFKRKAK